MREAAWISASVRPACMACRRWKTRSGLGRASEARRPSRSRVGWSNLPPQPKPQAPTSRERSAFWKDSLKVRPMAMASPTDFMAEVRVLSAPTNFSKAKRGIFVTT